MRVVSDAHEGLKATVTKVLRATWRVSLHEDRAGAGRKSGRSIASPFIATTIPQDTSEAASSQWRNVADQIRPKVPKLAATMEDAEEDVLAYMTFKTDEYGTPARRFRHTATK